MLVILCLSIAQESQIGWIFKSKANVSYCLLYMTVDQWFDTMPLAGGGGSLPERVKGQAFVYKTKPCVSLRGFSKDSGTYGSHSKGHCVRPLVLTLYI